MFGVVNSQLQAETTWPAVSADVPQRLVLTWGAHEVEVTARHPLLTVGRGETCNLVIRSSKVSRLHARIEYRNAHFSLTDQSSNCTYVTGAAGTTCKISNETYVLMGTGTLSFGVDPATSRANLFRYAVGS